MTESSDYIGKVRAKGLANTGITEAILSRHHANKSGRLMIVASIKVAHIGEEIDGGKRDVDYIIEDLEPAPDMAEEHIRELVRSFHYERQLDAQGDLFEGDKSIEPKVKEVLARGAAHAPHPFLPVDAADDNGICDVCGMVDGANPAHAAHAAKGDPFGLPDGPESSDEPPSLDGAEDALPLDSDGAPDVDAQDEDAAPARA